MGVAKLHSQSHSQTEVWQSGYGDSPETSDSCTTWAISPSHIRAGWGLGTRLTPSIPQFILHWRQLYYSPTSLAPFLSQDNCYVHEQHSCSWHWKLLSQWLSQPLRKQTLLTTKCTPVRSLCSWERTTTQDAHINQHSVMSHHKHSKKITNSTKYYQVTTF